MTKLPRVSGRELVAALLKRNFVLKRQHGSHIVLRRDDPFAQVVVPDHRELDKGMLRSILRQADISIKEISELL